MSAWDYRVIRKEHKETNSITYHIHEVYYSDNGTIESWTERPVQPLGENLFELREDIRYFLRAFRRPVLEEKIIEGKPQLVNDDDHYEINPGHYFEFMDRTSIALDYVYQFLGSHPLISKEPQLKAVYQKVEDALADLYQLSGRLDDKQENN
ncbi:MAG: hypothetical protein OMM_07384 [Candidatus Magnetoglobus multicellularis str. Araruama]|uniref:Uncharacterized protein n=1 Tax=Candidatus Magnetoglobus multicellularis str. Araruama TaxID=890399 RepID=A0A1V1PDC7_9BACT|nr:MAG: hypothetical protein OMM_07384 [Candidatus Magnetoglobus multicellularis str. Araruama]